MKILIADDSAVARMMLERALTRLGHDFAVAEDGRRPGSSSSAQAPTS